MLLTACGGNGPCGCHLNRWKLIALKNFADYHLLLLREATTSCCRAESTYVIPLAGTIRSNGKENKFSLTYFSVKKKTLKVKTNKNLLDIHENKAVK